MGDLTLLQLKAELRSNLGDRTDLDSRLERVLNLSQKRMAQLHDFQELRRKGFASITPTGTAQVDKYVPKRGAVFGVGATQTLANGAGSANPISVDDGSIFSVGDPVVVFQGTTDPTPFETWITTIATNDLTMNVVPPLGWVDDARVLRPYQLRAIYSLIYKTSDTERYLVQVPHRQWDRILGDPGENASSGHPTHYCDFGNALELGPSIPSAAYELMSRWSAWPTDLNNDNQKSDYDSKDELILAYATHYFFHSLGMRDDASLYFNIFRTGMEAAKMEDLRNPNLDYVPRGTGVQSASSVVKPWADPFVRRTV